MTVLALTGGDIALIILAAFWGLLVLALCVVLLNTYRVLESTKILIDGIRQETVPLLGEVKTSVQGVNRELERVDSIIERVERITALFERATAGPLTKVIGLAAGARKFTQRMGGNRYE
jgi:hypothetical protein